MAAAVVPLVLSAAPAIINLIAGLVHKKAPVQEASLGNGTGPVKFANLFVDVMQDLAKAHAAGQITTIPDDATAKTIIQSIISSMKLLGLLDGVTVDSVVAAAKPSPSSTSFALANGQTLTFSVT